MKKLKHETFSIDAFKTQSDVELDLKLAYHTTGDLDSDGANAILVLTSYAAQHDEAMALLAQSDALDLSDYFIIYVNMFCNGLSSSPSNTPAPFDGPRFPLLTVHDNVTCQHKLLTEHLNVQRLRLVTGYSMGAMQAYAWASQYPAMVDSFLPICGAARVSPHNSLFLDSAKTALIVDQNYAGGDYKEPPLDGLLAFGKVYAAWVFSQSFFREQLYVGMGMSSVEEVVAFIQKYFMRRDTNDLLGMLATWQHSDISKNDLYQGDFATALGTIKARSIVMPCTTDLYFTVADSEIEVEQLSNTELRPIPSLFGHLAGNGSIPDDKAFIDQAINELLTNW